MATHRNAVNPPPLAGLSPAATTMLPPSYDEEAPDTQDDLPVIEIEASRPTERTPIPPSLTPTDALAVSHTILSPPPQPGDFDDEHLPTLPPEPDACTVEMTVASSPSPLDE